MNLGPANSKIVLIADINRKSRVLFEFMASDRVIMIENRKSHKVNNAKKSITEKAPALTMFADAIRSLSGKEKHQVLPRLCETIKAIGLSGLKI